MASIPGPVFALVISGLFFMAAYSMADLIQCRPEGFPPFCAEGEYKCAENETPTANTATKWRCTECCKTLAGIIGSSCRWVGSIPHCDGKCGADEVEVDTSLFSPTEGYCTTGKVVRCCKRGEEPAATGNNGVTASGTTANGATASQPSRTSED